MSPTILLDDGKPFLALGSPGGATIITSVSQTILGYLDRGLSLVDAIAAPRLSSRNGLEGAEPALLASPLGAGLTALGHKLTNAGEIGAVTAIRSLGRRPLRGRGRDRAARWRLGHGRAAAALTRTPCGPEPDREPADRPSEVCGAVARCARTRRRAGRRQCRQGPATGTDTRKLVVPLDWIVTRAPLSSRASTPVKPPVSCDSCAGGKPCLASAAFVSAMTASQSGSRGGVELGRHGLGEPAAAFGRRGWCRRRCRPSIAAPSWTGREPWRRPAAPGRRSRGPGRSSGPTAVAARRRAGRPRRAAATATERRRGTRGEAAGSTAHRTVLRSLRRVVMSRFWQWPRRQVPFAARSRPSVAGPGSGRAWPSATATRCSP